MKLVMTKKQADKYKLSPHIKTIDEKIERLDKDDEIIEALNEKTKRNFAVWFTRTLPNKIGLQAKDKLERNKKRYEVFVTGYLHFYDEWINAEGNPTHFIYFKWRDTSLTVFIADPPAVLNKPPRYSLVTELQEKQGLRSSLVNNAAAASDPPPPGKIPPPPLEG